MKRTNYITNLIISVVLFVAILCGQVFLSAFSLPTFAEETATEHSDVLADLSADETFSAEDYPVLADRTEKARDDEMDVLQFAEGDKGGLYVYVYKPYSTVQNAKYITLSTNNPDNPNFKRYSLTFCNQTENGALQKYALNSFTVSSATQRYYHVSGIYFDASVNPYSDEDYFADDFEINCYSTKIDKFWIASGTGDATTWQTSEVEASITIPAEDLFVGHIHYPTGFFLTPGKSNVNSNFVAFRTDVQIDKLFAAKVAYDLCYKYFSMAGWITSVNEEGVKKDQETTLTVEDTVTLEDWYYKYEWERIQTVNRFIATEELTDDTKTALEGFDYVLRFVETENYTYSDGTYSTINREWVENVQILQFRYMTAGIMYNVGVISDAVTPDAEPENDVIKTGVRGFLNSRAGSLAKLLLLALGIVILSLLAPFWWPVLEIVFKGLWWLVSAPFKAIANAVKKRKNKKKGAHNGTKTEKK